MVTSRVILLILQKTVAQAKIIKSVTIARTLRTSRILKMLSQKNLRVRIEMLKEKIVLLKKLRKVTMIGVKNLVSAFLQQSLEIISRVALLTAATGAK